MQNISSNNSVAYTQEVIVEIINHFNNVTGRKLTLHNKENNKLISKLVELNYTVKDMKTVIDYKYKEWNKVLPMKKYIRIQTLFDICNFRTYLKEFQSKIHLQKTSPERALNIKINT